MEPPKVDSASFSSQNAVGPVGMKEYVDALIKAFEIMRHLNYKKT
jgi:hypothetical protein